MYAVILAGGGGTRLWPLSRPETPKPFLPLLGDRSLLQRTVDRIVGHPSELALEPVDVTVVADRRYAGLVRDQVAGVRVLAEPVGRNTAAAIALAALAIERDPSEVMLVLPADHIIADAMEPRFRTVLAAAETELARGAFDIDDPLVTLGVETTRPATEYGYLIPDLDRRQDRTLTAYPLVRFQEKPSVDEAIQLRNNPGTAWNAGIFLWRRRAIQAALARYTGLMTLLGPVVASESGLATAYEHAAPLSIDRAVMESAASDHHVVMGSMAVGWNDLGSWTQLLAEIGAGGEGRVIQPNEPASADAGDLVIERSGGRLTVSEGPRPINGPGPSALIVGGASFRPQIDALIARVAAWEERH
ncbi:MAG TPA: sugar phosphate nucleotidyltransferase [Candidatus Limnocylindrales bacterium]|nr:sugar phosphate nucleotidyltransferase [Candidatus Limnocylindrales bacterium]